MQRDLGLTDDQAAERIGNESRAAAVAAGLQRSLGHGFAGAQVSGETAELTVATTDAPTDPTDPPTDPGGSWAAGTVYATGDRVTYGGVGYRCLQAHTALTGREPPNVPALWERG